MPIDIRQFDESSDDDLREQTNAERVIEFLAHNDEQAYTRTEIVEGTGVDTNSIGPTLTRLRERGLVRHKGEYWAITNDRERLQNAASLSSVLRRLDEQDGGFDLDKWDDIDDTEE